MAKNRQTRHVRPASTNQQATARAYYDRSLALVIGIDEYGQHPPLGNAVNDARAVAEVLEKMYGFEVFSLYDKEATRDNVRSWLHDELGRRTEDNDRLIIFFAGHGITREMVHGRNRGYLVPVGASVDRYADYVDMFELADACEGIRAKHILIILDCCFSGVLSIAPRTRASVTVPDNPEDIYLETITKKRAWQVLSAGADDEQVLDSSLRPDHSPFTQALLDGLAGEADLDGDRIITARGLAEYIEPRVVRETAYRGQAGQAPYFNILRGSEQGEVVFVLPPTAAESAPLDFDWVTIPAGEFLMGSDKQKDSMASDDETPQHKLTLPEYRIARVPVTNAQYKLFVDASGHGVPDHWTGSDNSQRQRRPSSRECFLAGRPGFL